MARRTTVALAITALTLVGAQGALAIPEEGGGAPTAGCTQRALSDLSAGELVMVDAFTSTQATRKAVAFVGLTENTHPDVIEQALTEIRRDILCRG